MLITKELEYYDDELLCRGFIAYDSSEEKPKPGVIVAHDWGGRGEFACNKAKQLAGMGYVGFAIDMFGQARLGQDNVQRRALITPLVQDRPKLTRRIMASFDAMTQLPQVDINKIAAIGYCFGGLCVLDLARSGVGVRGVASFHGLLTSPEGVENTSIPGKVLVLHGYDDPLVPAEQVNQFSAEMTERQVDWQMHVYGLTAHSFTNPEANDDQMGLHYNALSDHRSWVTTELFLEEVFA